MIKLKTVSLYIHLSKHLYYTKFNGNFEKSLFRERLKNLLGETAIGTLALHI